MDDSGIHSVWDIVLTDNKLLLDAQELYNCFYRILSKSDFNVIGHLLYKFNDEGKGVTGIFLLSQSHLSFHTYPENNYISIDLYTCGGYVGKVQRDIDVLFNDSKKSLLRTIDRGSNVRGCHITEKCDETYQ